MPEQRTMFRGKRLNARTVAMLQPVERLAGFEFAITPGSYNAGGMPASNGTHDGGGAVVIRARDLSTKQRADAVVSLRKVGFAARLRTPDQTGPSISTRSRSPARTCPEVQLIERGVCRPALSELVAG